MNIDDPLQLTSSTQDQCSVQILGTRIVRFILAYSESQLCNTVISRAKILQTIREIADEEKQKQCSFNLIYEFVDNKLCEIFGYHLYGLEARSQIKLGSKKRRHPEESQTDTEQPQYPYEPDVRSKGQTFILVRNITKTTPRYSQFLLDYGASLYKSRVKHNTYIGSDYRTDFQPTIQTAFGSDQQLALHGITAITISLVLLSKNNLLESELFEYYKKFGIPCDGNQIPILQITTKELLSLLVRQNYLSRYIENASDSLQDLVIYKIARRTQIEFPQSSLTKLCLQFLRLPADGTSTLLEKTIKLLVADAYSQF